MRVYAHMSGLFKASREFSPGFSGIKLYAAGLALISTTLVVGLATSDGLNDGPGSTWPLLGFALLALVAEGQTVRLTDNLQLSVAFLPLLFVRAPACCPHRGSHSAHRLWPAVHAVGHLDCE
jgi:hypothetical protein